MTPAELDACVLCGGLGTRLRSALPELPKALAEVGGRPFLEILLEWLARQGVRRFVLCAGYRADAIRERLGSLARFGEVRLSVERERLGTGGALRLALEQTSSDPLLVANGDSICPLDLAAMLAAHREHRAGVTLAVVATESSSERGEVRADSDGRIHAFSEKPAAPGIAGLENAGVYLIRRELVAERAADHAFSLERELFPARAGLDAFAFRAGGGLLDIGTPERLRGAAQRLRELELI